MRFDAIPWHERNWQLGVRFGAAFLWLLLISAAHLWLNFEHDERRVVRMGYMPVITNMAAPLLDYASLDAGEVRYKALKFSSFAEMAEALRNGQIDAGFIIAPLPIVLRQQGEDVKVVMIGNRHESTLVARADIGAERVGDLTGKTVAVPMRYSGHNLALRRLMDEHNLRGQINIVEMNPPDMASAMAAGSLDAYFVGEPFAAQTVRNGLSEVVYYVEEIWPNFMCNVLITRQSLIEEDEEAVAGLVQAAVRSGLWAQQHRERAAEIASRYWGQPQDLVLYAMNTPEDRVLFERYTPVEAEYQEMADLMVRYGLLQDPDFGALLEDRFTQQANTADITEDLQSILQF